MQRHRKLLVASALVFVGGVVGVSSVSGDTNEAPTGDPPSR